MSYFSKEEVLERISNLPPDEAMMEVVSYARNRLSSVIGYIDLLSTDETMLEEAIGPIQENSKDLVNIVEAVADYWINLDR